MDDIEYDEIKLLIKSLAEKCDLITKNNDLVIKNNEAVLVGLKELEKITTNLTEEFKIFTKDAQANIKTLRQEYKGLVEIQQCLIHEKLGAPTPAYPKEYGETSSGTTTKSIGIELTSIADDRIKISGKKSFDVKEIVKQSGQSKAKFDAADKSWSIPAKYLDDLLKNFQAANLVKDKDYSLKITSQKSNQPDDDDDEADGFGSGF